MTYLNKIVPTRMIEVTLSSGQTASSGDFVLFDTIRATGSHGVTVNSTTGEIGLDTTKHYHIEASIHVDRSSLTSSWRFAWVDSTGAEISAEDGGYNAEWTWHSSGSSSGVPNPTFVAVYQSATPVSSIRLKATLLNDKSDILTQTSLFILEASLV